MHGTYATLGGGLMYWNRTGWLLAKDGSENHLARLKKYMKEYNFPHPSDAPVESDDESDGSDESE